MHGSITRFVIESNRIEGIERAPTAAELECFEQFIHSNRMTVDLLEHFVSIYQPGAKLRTEPGMNVYVGNHVPPPGGPNIRKELVHILEQANEGEDPYDVHVAYETLHPFMDGNGRSGRAIWAWQMYNKHDSEGLQLGFLHRWYYQSLENSRK